MKCDQCGATMVLDDKQDQGTMIYRGYVCPKCKYIKNTWVKKRKKREK